MTASKSAQILTLLLCYFDVSEVAESFQSYLVDLTFPGLASTK